MPRLDASQVPDRWKDILGPGETILWQGRPSCRLRVELKNGFEPVVGVLFILFGASKLLRPENAGVTDRTIGVILLLVGVYSLIGIHFLRAFERGRTSYILTDRRALIAKATFGRRSVKSYSIDPGSLIELRHGAPGSIFFATEVSGDGYSGFDSTAIGFERIDDYRTVFAKIQEIQNRS